MPLETYESLKQNLNKENINQLYLLYGEESYLINEILDLVKANVLINAIEEFNLDVFYGSDVDIEKVKDSIETLPLMASKRLVIIKEVENLNSSDLDSLNQLIEKPSPTTVLVLISSNIDRRKKFFKDFEKKGILTEFKRPFENQLSSWVTYITKKYSKTISTEANLLLQRSVGSQLSDIDSEINKISQYIGSKTLIEVNDVKQVVSPLKAESVFALTKAIGQKNKIHALECLANLLDFGENPVGILMLITRHFRILMQTQNSLSEGLSVNQIVSKIHVNSYFIKEYIDQSKNWSQAHLEKTYKSLIETDRALKSSPISSHIWLENFILNCCS